MGMRESQDIGLHVSRVYKPGYMFISFFCETSRFLTHISQNGSE